MYIYAGKTDCGEARRTNRRRPLEHGEATSSISTDLVTYLRGEGMNLKQIGTLISAGESFVSRVSRGERSFTLEHMARFEKALGKPIPVLLLESQWRSRVPKTKRALFEKALRLLSESAAIRTKLRG
jgi:hypothetical protein